MGDAYVKGKGKNELLAELEGTALPGTVIHEQQKMAILIRCTEDAERAVDRLRKSLERSAAAADRLSRAVFWLNAVLAVATVAGVIIAAISLLRGR